MFFYEIYKLVLLKKMIKDETLLLDFRVKNDPCQKPCKSYSFKA